MKRALFIGGGTIVGVAAVLAYVPTNFGSSSQSSPSAVPGTGGSTTPATGTTSTSTPNQTQTSAAPTASKTATGRSYSACGYGNVQVRITVVNGVVTRAAAVSYPNGDPRSQFINKQAIPWLQQQTLTAKNSSKISGVGGATCTSGAWTSSLQSALTTAGL